MYILGEQERAVLKRIIKYARYDYYKKRKNDSEELALYEDVLCSKTDLQAELEEKMDKDLEVEKIEDLFGNDELRKIVKALAYDDKLVLSMFYVKKKTDEQIAKRLNISRSGANKKRLRLIDYLQEECEKRGIKYV